MGEDVLTRPKTYTEVFEEQFPYYLSIGMPSAEYWEGDASLTRYYRKAFLLKQKNEARVDDYNAWLNGLYVHKAISSIFCSAKTERYEYPDKPLLEMKAQKERMTDEEREEAQRAAEISFHHNLMAQYGKKSTAES